MGICSKASVAIVAFLLSGCGGGGGGSSSLNPPTPANNLSSVVGTVRAANGDPIPFAAVFVAADGAAAAAQRRRARAARPQAEIDDCLATIPTSALARTCSDAQGSFSLDLSGVTRQVQRLSIQKGALNASVPITATLCPVAQCALPAAATTLTQGGNAQFPKMLVVTGAFDEIESVLAKIGDANVDDEVAGAYGRVGADGRFVYGSEIGSRLTVVAGGGESGYTDAQNLIVPYPSGREFLDGTRALINADGSLAFDVVFINCGSESDASLAQPEVQQRLRAYVEAGGRLYATDLSYDFIEQTYPDTATFKNDPGENTAGAQDAAELGTSGISVNGDVSLAAMRAWLGSVRVNSNDGTQPGNPEAGAIAGQVSGALTASGTLPIGGFLSDWAVIDSIPAASGTTLAIDSGQTNVEGQLDRPLTFLRRVGDKGGALLYSSYHTADASPSKGFWPQERVLQYLIFEAF